MRTRLKFSLLLFASLLASLSNFSFAAPQQNGFSQQGQQNQKTPQKANQKKSQKIAQRDEEPVQDNQEIKQQKKQQQKQGQTQKNSRKAIPKDELPEASQTQVRRFHEVLDELLAEFGYDIKSGQIKGLKNLSIRRIQINDVLPRSYESYVEMLVSERIRENSNIRLVNCLPCKTKSSTLAEGKIIINSPSSNVQRLDQAAGQLSIENFMDVILVYHTTHMVLAFNIFEAGSKELVWARAYNSETIRSRYQRLAIDYKQIEKGRAADEYEPEYRILVGGGAGILPNINASSDEKQFMHLHLRGGEKFNNRKDEFGLMFNLHMALSAFKKEYPTQGSSSSSSSEAETKTGLQPYKQGFGVYAYYAHNLLGNIESYDQVRHGFNGGLGFFMAPSYLAPSLRGGWDIYLGRRFTTSLGLLYNMASSVLVNGQFQSVAGGAGGDFTLSINF